MYITSSEEIVMENIDSSNSTISEKIKEAILEMNIIKGKKVSRDELIRLIESYS